MTDIGSGPPLILIPGIQGRREWIAPTARALARTFRVLSYSLPGERGSGMQHDASAGFGMFINQIDQILERAGEKEAVICGVSFGGLIATAYAAERPERTQRLVLASAPGPRWTPDTRVHGYIKSPFASVPAFVMRAAGHLLPEVAAAFPAWGPRWGFIARHLSRVLAAPMSPHRMADRILLAGDVDFVSLCRRISAQTLIIAGEPGLDRVVPVAGMADYLELIPDARMTTIARGGHIGMVTRADAFAGLVTQFVQSGITPLRLDAVDERGAA